jgi:DNA helicase-2/ATP-dependent DNA helicase PcrA
MIFVPSKYQQRLFDWVEQGSGSALLVAVAGSGKSTSLGECLRRIPERSSVQVFAFNSTIAKDFRLRIEAIAKEEGRPFAKVRASTFHSVGFYAVCKHLGKTTREIETDGNKLRTLCRNWLGESDLDLYGDFICRLTSLAKGQGVGCLMPDVEQNWWEIVHFHDLFLESEEATEEQAIRLARELLKKSNEVAKAGHIDFDDQLYLPLLWRLRLWQNDWVLVDEAQDTNPVRRALAKLALRPGGRLLAAGDQKQGIYGFTGASHDAMDLIKKEFNCIELPLSISYRCCKAVVYKAKTLVPYIEASETAPEGVVEQMGFEEALQKGLFDAKSVVLCRNTAPLITTAYGLIAKGIGCTVLGREIGTGLTNLIKKMKARSLAVLQEKLEAYRIRETAKFTARGEEGKAEAVNDRVACIDVVIGFLDENARTVGNLITKIEGLFTEGNGVLTLATCHKSKGREWDRVFILRPELMPSKWARQEHQFQQELNLQYVAWTRARVHLVELLTELKP